MMKIFVLNHGSLEIAVSYYMFESYLVHNNTS